MRRGPLLMVIAALFFSAMVAAVKVAHRELEPLDIVAWRAVVAVPMALLLAGRTKLDLGNRRTFAYRALLGFFAMLCTTTAAEGLRVADLSLIAKLTPVLIGLLAPLVLGQREKVGALIWIALAGGLLGSALLIGPELAVGSTFGLWAVAGSFLSAGAQMSVRSLGRTEEPEAVVFWLQLALLFLAVAGLLIVDGRLPTLPSRAMVLPVVATGVFATIGQYFMTKAYQLDRATLVAGASYAGPIWGVLIDLTIFGTLPTVQALAGGALIIASGLVFLRRG